MKKVLYITLAVLILGGTAFALSQSNLLKGTYPFKSSDELNTEINKGNTIDINVTQSATASSYANKIKDQMQLTEEAKNQAITAFESNDKITLSTSKTNAELAYNEAGSLYEELKALIEQWQIDYYEKITEYENTKAELSLSESTLETKITDYVDLVSKYAEIWPDYYDNASTTVVDGVTTITGMTPDDIKTVLNEIQIKVKTPDNGTTSNILTTTKAEEIYALSTEAYNQYIQASNDYQRYATTLELEETEKVALEGEYNATQTSLEEAEGYLALAKTYKDTANSYEFVDCDSITLDPSSYQMSVDEAEANFSFVITAKSEENTGLFTRNNSITNLIKASILAFNRSQVEKEEKEVGPIDSDTKWFGTLKITGSAAANFLDESSALAMPQLEVDADSETPITVNVEGGSAGETITVSYPDDMSCTATLEITQDTSITYDPLDEKDFSSRTVDEDLDFDQDGLSDYDEIHTYSTDPKNADTDDDGVNDGDEVTAGTDPLVADVVKTPISTTPVTTPTTETPVTTPATTPTTTPTTPVDTLSTEEKDVIKKDTYVCSAPFADTYGHWAEDQICRMYEASVVKGKAPTTFDPEGDITRAEAIKIVIIMAGYSASNTSGLTTEFLDLNQEDWYYDYLLIAEDKDIIRTRDFGNYFDPNTPISRADLILYAVRASGKTTYSYDTPFKDVEDSDYFAYAVSIANKATVDVPYDDTDDEISVIEGYDDDTFRPYDSISRAEAITIAYRMYLAWFAE
ncbi:MAG: S-layer homology domain-containing protein [Candidatus Gracilibacteria bacterium]